MNTDTLRNMKKRIKKYINAYIESSSGREVDSTVELLLDTYNCLNEIVLDKEKNEEMDVTYRRCICEYGTNPQIDMAIEEMSELTKALLKYRRISSQVRGENVNPVENSNLVKAYDDIIDEIADVRIMCRQMEILFQAEEDVEKRIYFKTDRQAQRLEDRHKD